MDRLMGHSERTPAPRHHMRIVWSPEATADLAQLREYIARDNPDAAQRVVERIFNSVGRDLSENPELGHPGRVPGTRELVMPHTRS
jgi:toxin ParE1/3/4